MSHTWWRIVVGVVGLSWSLYGRAASAAPVTEAPTGFAEQTNGFTAQTQYEADRDAFTRQEQVADGLGPVYNAQSCGECHQTPVTGGASQLTEVRAGQWRHGAFTAHPGGSLVQDRVTVAALQEHVLPTENVQTLRLTTSALGAGFVESVADETLAHLAAQQPLAMRGQLLLVPVLEAGSAVRVGRFGWKDQHASLVSFSADAYLNEMGITTPFFPTENTADGRSVAAVDPVPDPEDTEESVQTFARFLRATTAPPRDDALAVTPDAQAGSQLFAQVGCPICHVRAMVTAPAGTVLNGGTFTVPPALGDKRMHPFSDFLLHDIGTGDGIVEHDDSSTRTLVRTAPLWGLRTRSRLMHDGLSLTMTDAIGRHAGQARPVRQAYEALPPFQQRQLLVFLRSL